MELERTTGKPNSVAEWQRATHGRFTVLAAKNEAHFAPPDRRLVPVSGDASEDHKATWERYHKSALELSKAGDKDRALMVNAFGDHFLTDAFAAGHLVNRRDVMEMFRSQFDEVPRKNPTDDREFDRRSKVFFDEVAKAAFVGPVKAAFSALEDADPKKTVHFNTDSWRAFSVLLQQIELKEPDRLGAAVVKAGVHDPLNRWPGGIPVKNRLNQQWPLSGDTTLNTRTLAIARQAVAQSQRNVISAYKMTSALDLPALYKAVWDYTPELTVEGMTIVNTQVATRTRSTDPALRAAVVGLITAEFRTIIAELRRLGYLRPA